MYLPSNLPATNQTCITKVVLNFGFCRPRLSLARCTVLTEVSPLFPR